MKISKQKWKSNVNLWAFFFGAQCTCILCLLLKASCFQGEVNLFSKEQFRVSKPGRRTI